MIPYRIIRQRHAAHYIRMRVLLEPYCQSRGLSPATVWETAFMLVANSTEHYMKSDQAIADIAARAILSQLTTVPGSP